MPNSTSTPTTTSHLHFLPAGSRLDFEMMPGYFVYVYRRQRQQPWQCVARNACSPYFDQSALTAADSPVEYLVCYCDAAGTIKASRTVAASPATVFSPVPTA